MQVQVVCKLDHEVFDMKFVPYLEQYVCYICGGYLDVALAREVIRGHKERTEHDSLALNYGPKSDERVQVVQIVEEKYTLALGYGQ